METANSVCDYRREQSRNDNPCNQQVVRACIPADSDEQAGAMILHKTWWKESILPIR